MALVQELLDRLLRKNRIWTGKGTVTTYIPALGRADQTVLGVTVATGDGKIASSGDFKTQFTLQSISKIFALIVALRDRGPDVVFDRVGMEPTGDPFHSIVKLETLEPFKPLNPMINAGAIAVCDLIRGSSADERFERVLRFVRQMCGNPAIDVDWTVYESEKETGHRNRALAYFLKSRGLIDHTVEDTLDVYFRQCSIEVSSRDLARAGLFLAQDEDHAHIVPVEILRLVKTFMVTCGMYNASGEFAIRVGIPAKSGVGGGILATVPYKNLGIGVIGPALDEKGNSIAGFHLLEDWSRELHLSIF